MKVLVGCWPAHGHLLPMLPLVRAAQRAGHDVVVSSGSDLPPLLARLGVPAHRSGVTLAESYARMPDHATISALPPAEQPAFAARNLFGAGAVDRARDLLVCSTTWRPDLVVHDTLELGSATAAVGRGIPQVTHGYGPMVPGTPVRGGHRVRRSREAGLPDPVPAVLAGHTSTSARPACAARCRTRGRTTRPLRPRRGGAARVIRRSTWPACRTRTPSTSPSARS